jgi:hypothetical protein
MKTHLICRLRRILPLRKRFEPQSRYENSNRRVICDKARSSTAGRRRNSASMNSTGGRPTHVRY